MENTYYFEAFPQTPREAGIASLLLFNGTADKRLNIKRLCFNANRFDFTNNGGVPTTLATISTLDSHDPVVPVPVDSTNPALPATLKVGTGGAVTIVATRKQSVGMTSQSLQTASAWRGTRKLSWGSVEGSIGARSALQRVTLRQNQGLTLCWDPTDTGARGHVSGRPYILFSTSEAGNPCYWARAVSTPWFPGMPYISILNTDPTLVVTVHDIGIEEFVERGAVVPSFAIIRIANAATRVGEAVSVRKLDSANPAFPEDVLVRQNEWYQTTLGGVPGEGMVNNTLIWTALGSIPGPVLRTFVGVGTMFLGTMDATSFMTTLTQKWCDLCFNLTLNPGEGIAIINRDEELFSATAFPNNPIPCGAMEFTGLLTVDEYRGRSATVLPEGLTI
jgi:hypothetical protein